MILESNNIPFNILLPAVVFSPFISEQQKLSLIPKGIPCKGLKSLKIK